MAVPVEYTPCLKKCATFIFYNNFGKLGPVFIIFFRLIQKGSTEEDEIKTTTSLKSVATLPCEK